MTPVDLNRLRQARRWATVNTAEREYLAWATDAVLDATHAWWCQSEQERCDSDTPFLPSRKAHADCGYVALVPVKGES